MIAMASNIRRHIAAAHPSAILTTREMQYCGSRSAVDQELSRLVRVGELIRLTNGVFVRHDHPQPFMAPVEIIRSKATAFGKQIVLDGAEALAQLNFVETPKDKLSFSSTGSTTELTLHLHGMRVQVKGVSARKLQLGDSAPGTLLRSLWQTGKRNCSSDLVRSAMQLLNRSEKESIWNLIFLLPAWLKHMIMPMLPQIPFEKKSHNNQTQDERNTQQTSIDCAVESSYQENVSQRTHRDEASSIEKSRTQNRNSDSKPSAVRTFGELLYQFRLSVPSYGFGSSSVNETPAAYECATAHTSTNLNSRHEQHKIQTRAHYYRPLRILLTDKSLSFGRSHLLLSSA